MSDRDHDAPTSWDEFWELVEEARRGLPLLPTYAAYDCPHVFLHVERFVYWVSGGASGLGAPSSGHLPAWDRWRCCCCGEERVTFAGLPGASWDHGYHA